MHRKRWWIPDSESTIDKELDSLLEELYPQNGGVDRGDSSKRRSYFNSDPKSRMRLQMAFDGCTFSMIWLAKKVFEEHPNTDETSMEVAFRWLIKAAREGDIAAVGHLRKRRDHCPEHLLPYIDQLINDRCTDAELFAESVCARFRKVYRRSQEPKVTGDLLRLISGGCPEADTLFARRFHTLFSDVLALILTHTIALVFAAKFISRFDVRMSRALPSMMRSLYSFSLVLFFIATMITLSAIFTVRMYSKVIGDYAKKKNSRIKYRMNILLTQAKLIVETFVLMGIMYAFCGSGLVAVTTFGITTCLLGVLDTLKDIQWWFTRDRSSGQYPGRSTLILKIITVILLVSLFPFESCDLQVLLETAALSFISCSVLYLVPSCSPITFVFLTAEPSLILQGVSLLLMGSFLTLRQAFLGVSSKLKILLYLVLALCLVPLLTSPMRTRTEVSQSDVYDACANMRRLQHLVSCDRIKGSLVNVSGYVNSIELTERGNLLENFGLSLLELDDGKVKLNVSDFERLSVEVKLQTNYLNVVAYIDDNAFELLQTLQSGDYLTVRGEIQELSTGPSPLVRIVAESAEVNDNLFVVKQLEGAWRDYIEKVAFRLHSRMHQLFYSSAYLFEAVSKSEL